MAARLTEVFEDELLSPPRQRRYVIVLLELLALTLVRGEALPLDGDTDWRRAENGPVRPATPLPSWDLHRRQLAEQRRQRVAERASSQPR